MFAQSILLTTIVCACILSLMLLLNLYPGFRMRRTPPPNNLDFLGPLKPVQSNRYRDLEYCEMITSGEMEVYELYSIYGPLEARAGPNQRLVRTFGIDNAFTTIDEGYWRQFRRDTGRSLTKSDEGWRSFAGTLRNSICQALTDMSEEEWRKGVLLVPLVQSLVLKFAIQFFFEGQPSSLDDATVAVIADKINILWIASKRHLPAKKMIKDQKELFSALQKIMPYDKNDPRKNPLNLILPAYETMWRIVLRCFLEVRFRNAKSCPAYIESFETFYANPTLPKLKERSETNGISIEHIVNEALRLYPPTRRIYRQDNPYSFVAADIEFLHRDPEIWGENTLLFRPGRWNSVSEDATKAYMPFGGPGHFTCPSKGNAGPRMIGLLVAALLGEFTEDWRWKAGCDKDNIDNVEPLSLERDSYSTLRLYELATGRSVHKKRRDEARRVQS